jgi:hypothetical protein
MGVGSAPYESSVVARRVVGDGDFGVGVASATGGHGISGVSSSVGVGSAVDVVLLLVLFGL